MNNTIGLQSPIGHTYLIPTTEQKVYELELREVEMHIRVQTLESQISILQEQMNTLIPAVGRLIEELSNLEVIENDGLIDGRDTI